MIKLLPRQEVFFDLFEQQAETVNKGAQYLAGLLSDFRNVEDVAFKLKATEHDGDEIAHEIMRKLNTTFVTPLDREDIHSLTSALDDILDYIETASDRMALYEIKEPTEASIKLSAILAKSTELTLQAVCGLRDMKNAKTIHEVCIEINRLENQGDQINRAALAELFKMIDKPVEALKWREIYGHIETAIDKCEEVAEIIEATLLKNA
jgi:predicted phosphate transport protein (TIGR00153 family)